MENYESDLAASIHETVADLFKAGVVDEHTMKRFDDSCLTPVSPLSPEEILEVRKQAKNGPPI